VKAPGPNIEPEHLSALGKPPGYGLMADFLVELRRGTIPLTPTTTRLRDAYREILAEVAEPLDALGLKKQPGQRGAGINALERVRFIAQHIESNPQRRGALEAALRAAAKHFGRDKRHLERLWNEFGHHYQQYSRDVERFFRDGKVPDLASVVAFSLLHEGITNEGRRRLRRIRKINPPSILPV
jgi:hypothetical protein